MSYKFFLFAFYLLILRTEKIRGQEPHLPPANLGMSNMQDGKPPSPGWYNMEYIQEYEASATSTLPAITAFSSGNRDKSKNCP